MARLNTREGPPQLVGQVWVGAVGANANTVDGDSGVCARAIVVGVVAGALVLKNIRGVNQTFLAADIIAANYVLRGQWVQIVAAGSASHTLQVWY